MAATDNQSLPLYDETVTNLSTAYSDRASASSGPPVSMVERAILCDLLDELGPHEPTLCEGWTTHHLAAHLKVREGSPLDQIQSIIPGRGDTYVASVVRSTPFEALVSAVRSGPQGLTVTRLPRVDPLVNTLELFIHHEDVRRAASQWESRLLPAWAEDQIWGRLTGAAKLILRRKPGGVVLERSDHDARTDSGTRATVSKGDNPVVLRGVPSQLALYVSGRQGVARVETDGNPGDIDRLSR